MLQCRCIQYCARKTVQHGHFTGVLPAAQITTSRYSGNDTTFKIKAHLFITLAEVQKIFNLNRLTLFFFYCANKKRQLVIYETKYGLKNVFIRLILKGYVVSDMRIMACKENFSNSPC